MNDEDLKDSMEAAATRARRETAERKYYGERLKSYSCTGFTVSKRNPHHWDVMAAPVPGQVAAMAAAGIRVIEPEPTQERAFRIRGGGASPVLVYDERWNPNLPPARREPMTFRSLATAMAWISEELMRERVQSYTDAQIHEEVCDLLDPLRPPNSVKIPWADWRNDTAAQVVRSIASRVKEWMK